MARQGHSLKELVDSEGTDKYEAGVYKCSDNSLFGPIHSITASGAVKITALKNKALENMYVNLVNEGIALAVGETIWFRQVVYEITITDAAALFHYTKQEYFGT